MLLDGVIWIEFLKQINLRHLVKRLRQACLIGRQFFLGQYNVNPNSLDIRTRWSAIVNAGKRFVIVLPCLCRVLWAHDEHELFFGVEDRGGVTLNAIGHEGFRMKVQSVKMGLSG